MEIRSNGSKWAGESPDSVETLLGILKREPLDSTFEKFGNFFYRLPDNRYHAFGNFRNRSHGFDIIGEREEMEPLRVAIRQNQKRKDYGSR